MLCTKCQAEKQVENFYSSKKRKSGRHPWCKECCARYRIEKQYDSYSRRSEYFKIWQKKYRTTQAAKEYDRKYRQEYHQTFSGLLSKLLSSAKKRAKACGLAYDLDTEWIAERLKKLECEATGMKLSLDTDKSMQHTYNRPSIDRKDNSLGYTKENCHVVSVIYNKAKSDGLHSHVQEMAECLTKKQLM